MQLGGLGGRIGSDQGRGAGREVAHAAVTMAAAQTAPESHLAVSESIAAVILGLTSK